jgi:hypothetical protein
MVRSLLRDLTVPLAIECTQQTPGYASWEFRLSYVLSILFILKLQPMQEIRVPAV